MGVIIQQTAIAENTGHSAIRNAARAAEQCLTLAGADKADIGLLINVGIYRDHNIMEPSVASLIQNELAMGLDIGAEALGPTTFSFDVVNGSCGFLNAVQIADAYLRNGTIQRALIVAGDTHPSMTAHPAFPYQPLGAAALLGFDSDTSKGFQVIDYQSELKGNSPVAAYGDFTEMGVNGRAGGTFHFEPDHTNTLQQLLVSHLQRFLMQHQCPSPDYFLGSAIASDFVKNTVQSAELDAVGAAFVDTYAEFQGDIHSATLIAAFDQIQANLKGEQTLLLASAGSGNATACAFYHT